MSFRTGSNKNITELTFGSGIQDANNVLGIKCRPFSSNIGVCDATSVYVYGTTAGLHFDNVRLFFDNDVTFRGPTSFSGTCFLHGGDHHISLKDSASLNILADSDLNVEVARIDFYKPGVFSPDNYTSKLRFLDCNLRLLSDIIWPGGGMEFDGLVDLNGSYSFLYQSDYTMTITENSTLLVRDGATLSLGRADPTANQPLEFYDSTSWLELKDATLKITGTGAQLTKGRVDIESSSDFDVTTTSHVYGLIIGDGTAANDCELHLNTGCEFDVSNGMLVLNNNNLNKVILESHNSSFDINRGAVLYLERPVNIEKGTTIFADSSTLIIPTDSYFTMSQALIGKGDIDISDLRLTGSVKDVDTLVLDDNDAIVYGSASYSPNITVSGSNATLRGSGNYDGQIDLGNKNSSLNYKMSTFQHENIILNDGTLTLLTQDLKFLADNQVTGSGIVDLTHHTVNFGSKDTTFTGSIYWDGSDVGALNLSSNCELSSSWTFSGNVIIHGNGYKLQMINGGMIVVEKGSKLTLHNMTLGRVSGYDVRCMNDASVIKLEDVDLGLDGNFTFTQGAMEIERDVIFSGNKTFSYDSAMTCSIIGSSSLTLQDDLILATGRKNTTAPNQPFVILSAKGKLILDESSLNVNLYGMTLTKGQVIINGASYLNIESSDTDYGFRIGDGIAANDLHFHINGGATFNVDDGVLVYNNAGSDGFHFNNASKLAVASGAKIYANIDMDLSDGIIYADRGASIEIKAGKSITNNNTRFEINSGSLMFDYTGTLTEFPIFALGSGDRLSLVTNGFEYAIYVTDGSDSIIEGQGVCKSKIQLADSSVTLTLGLVSTLGGDIVLNGGTLYVDDNLSFADDKLIRGSGTVQLNGHKLSYGGTDLSWTSSILWDNASDVELNSRTSWSTTNTFMGTSKLQGNGNVLDLSLGGGIFVGNDGTLDLTDVVIKNLSSSANPKQIILGNAASKIRMSNVAIELDNDFSVTSGNIYIEGPTTFMIKNYDWTFDNLGSLSVDGVTLWKDGLNQIVCGDIVFNPSSLYSSISSGTIKQAANEDIIVTDTSALGGDFVDWGSLTNTWIEFDSRLSATYGYILNLHEDFVDWGSLTNTWIEFDSRINNIDSCGATFIHGDYTFDNEERADDNYYILGTAYLSSGGNVLVGLFGGQFDNLNMNDGCMTLSQDLIITGSLILDVITSGTITNDGKGDKIIFMDEDQRLDGHLTFTGDIVIDCDHQSIDLNQTGTLWVTNGVGSGNKTLLFRNSKLAGLHDKWMFLEGTDQISTVSFDNVIFESDPYSIGISGNDNFMAFKDDECMFNAGFKLPNNISLATKYPFSGILNLNGQTLTLGSDLYLDDSASFAASSGTISTDGTNRRVYFGSAKSYESDLTVGEGLIIDGEGFDFDLNSGSITIAEGKTLKLRNMGLKNVGSGWLRFGSSSSRLIFENVWFYGAHYILMNQWDQLSGDVEYFTYEG